MKIVKKTIAMVLTVAMLLSIAVTAFAALPQTFTFRDGKGNMVTFTLQQMMNNPAIYTQFLAWMNAAEDSVDGAIFATDANGKTVQYSSDAGPITSQLDESEPAPEGTLSGAYDFAGFDADGKMVVEDEEGNFFIAEPDADEFEETVAPPVAEDLTELNQAIAALDEIIEAELESLVLEDVEAAHSAALGVYAAFNLIEDKSDELVAALADLNENLTAVAAIIIELGGEDPTEPTEPEEPTAEEAAAAALESLAAIEEVTAENYEAAVAAIAAAEAALAAVEDIEDYDTTALVAAIEAVQAKVETYEGENPNAIAIAAAEAALVAFEPYAELEALEEDDTDAADVLEALENALLGLAEIEDQDELVADLEAAIEILEGLIEAAQPVEPVTADDAAFGDATTLNITLSGALTTPFTFGDVAITGADETVEYIGVANLNAVSDYTEESITYKHFAVKLNDENATITITFKTAVDNNTELEIALNGFEEALTAAYKNDDQAKVDAAIAALTAKAPITLFEEATTSSVKDAVHAAIGGLTTNINTALTEVVKKDGTDTTWTVTFTVIGDAKTETASADIEIYAVTTLAMKNNTYTIGSTAATTTITYIDGTITVAAVQSTVTPAPTAPVEIVLNPVTDELVIALLDSLNTGDTITVTDGKISAISINSTGAEYDLSDIDFTTLDLINATPRISIKAGIKSVTLPKAVTFFNLVFDFANASAGAGNNADVLIDGETNVSRIITVPATLKTGMSTFGKDGEQIFTVTTKAGDETFDVTFAVGGTLNFNAYINGEPRANIYLAVADITSPTDVLTLANEVTLSQGINLNGATLEIINGGSLTETTSYKVTLGDGGNIISGAELQTNPDSVSGNIKSWYDDVADAITAADNATNVVTVTRDADFTGTIDNEKLVVAPNVILTVTGGALTVSGTGKLELQSGSELILKDDLILPTLWGDLPDPAPAGENGWLGFFTTAADSKITFATATKGITVNTSVMTLKAKNLAPADGPTPAQTISISNWTFSNETPSDARITATAAATSAVLTLTGSFGIGDDDTLTIGENVTLYVDNTAYLVVDGTLVLDGGGLDIHASGNVKGSNDVGTIIAKGAKSSLKDDSSMLFGPASTTPTATLSEDAVFKATIAAGSFDMNEIELQSGTLTVQSTKYWAVGQTNDFTLCEGTVLNVNGNFVLAGAMEMEQGSTLNLLDGGLFGIAAHGVLTSDNANVNINNGEFRIENNNPLELGNIGNKFAGTGAHFNMRGRNAKLTMSTGDGLQGTPLVHLISSDATAIFRTESGIILDVDAVPTGITYTLSGIGLVSMSAQGEWTVGEKETLIIESGVELVISKDSAKALDVMGNVIVRGTLNVTGSGSNGITWTANKTDNSATITVEAGGTLKANAFAATNGATKKSAIVLAEGSTVVLGAAAAAEVKIGATAFTAGTKVITAAEAGTYTWNGADAFVKA